LTSFPACAQSTHTIGKPLIVSMPKVKNAKTAGPGLYVVVCTRNRSKSLSQLLQSQAFLSSLIEKIVVVDSSNQEPQIHENRITCSENSKIQLIPSEPGLPHQRNIGCAYIEKALPINIDPIVSFLDDDVEIQADYFDSVVDIMRSKPGILGAWDANLLHRNPSGLRKLLEKLNILTSSPFGISAAGLTNVGPVNSDRIIVDWVPGHSFSMHLSIWKEHQFNDQVRMTGEDLEFQFRASSQPKIMSSRLSVHHSRSPLERLSSGKVSFSEALFRFHLAEVYKDRFSRNKVLLGTVVFALFQLGQSPMSSFGAMKCVLMAAFARKKLLALIDSAGYGQRTAERGSYA